MSEKQQLLGILLICEIPKNIKSKTKDKRQRQEEEAQSRLVHNE
jgi:hypothetical protein